MKILMVCLGNICRSPLAEGILKHKAQKRGLDWQIDSAGTGPWHVGEPPHKGSQRVCKKYGVDISGQRGRQFHKEDFLSYNKIYVMDSENYQEVKRVAGELFDEAKINFVMNELHDGKNINVPDPWFANTDAAFEEVYKLLDNATEKIIEKYADQ